MTQHEPNTEETLLFAIKENPADLTCYSAYADCMEETGRKEEAAILRLHIELSGSDKGPGDERWKELLQMQGDYCKDASYQEDWNSLCTNVINFLWHAPRREFFDGSHGPPSALDNYEEEIRKVLGPPVMTYEGFRGFQRDYWSLGFNAQTGLPEVLWYRGEEEKIPSLEGWHMPLPISGERVRLGCLLFPAIRRLLYPNRDPQYVVDDLTAPGFDELLKLGAHPNVFSTEYGNPLHYLMGYNDNNQEAVNAALRKLLKEAPELDVNARRTQTKDGYGVGKTALIDAFQNYSPDQPMRGAAIEALVDDPRTDTNAVMIYSGYGSSRTALSVAVERLSKLKKMDGKDKVNCIKTLLGKPHLHHFGVVDTTGIDDAIKSGENQLLEALLDVKEIRRLITDDALGDLKNLAKNHNNNDAVTLLDNAYQMNVQEQAIPPGQIEATAVKATARVKKV